MYENRSRFYKVPLFINDKNHTVVKQVQLVDWTTIYIIDIVDSSYVRIFTLAMLYFNGRTMRKKILRTYYVSLVFLYFFMTSCVLLFPSDVLTVWMYQLFVRAVLTIQNVHLSTVIQIILKCWLLHIICWVNNLFSLTINISEK